MDSSSNEKRLPLGLGVVIVAVCTSYWPIFNAEFLLWDDASYVYRNPLVTASSWGEALHTAFSTVQCANYHPLTMLSHWLVWKLAGGVPRWHHLANVFLHGLNSCLVLLLLRQLGFRLWAATCLATLFAMHPVNVSAVAWVAERKELLCACLCLTSVILWVRARRRLTLVGAFLAGGMALLAKPTAVVLPALLGGWTVCCHVKSRWTVLRWFLLGTLSAAAAVIAGVTYRAQLPTAVHGAPLLAKVASALHALAWYVLALVFPVGLSPHHVRLAHWDSADVHVLGGFVLLGLMVWGGWRAFRGGNRREAWGVFWFLIVLSPVIGLVRVGVAPVAERYLYLSQVGLWILLCRAIQELGGLLSRRTVPIAWPTWGVAVVAALSAGVVLFATTVEYVQAWQNDEMLWRRVLRVYPNSGLARVNLAAYYAQVAAKPDEARRLLLQVEADDPDGQFKLARLNLLILKHNENPLDPMPLVEMERLLEQPPEADNRLVLRALVAARVNAAKRNLELNRLAAAVMHCRRGLEIAPGDPELRRIYDLVRSARSGVGPSRVGLR